jgi:hypothetical protein
MNPVPLEDIYKTPTSPRRIPDIPVPPGATRPQRVTAVPVGPGGTPVRPVLPPTVTRPRVAPPTIPQPRVTPPTVTPPTVLPSPVLPPTVTQQTIKLPSGMVITIPTPFQSVVLPPIPGGFSTPVLPPRPPTINTVEQNIKLKLAKSSFELYNTKPYADEDDETVINYTDLPEVAGVINPESLGFVWSMKRTIIDYRGRPMYLMEYLMKQSGSYVNSVLNSLDLPGLANVSMDIKYNLLWYLHVASDPYGVSLTTPELHYISRLSPEAVRNLLPASYSGPIDHASLIFAVVSGYRTPSPNVLDLPRYGEIVAYPAEAVWALAQQVYHIYNEEIEIIGEWPPHVYVALQLKTNFELPFVMVNSSNVESFLSRYQIISGRRIEDPINYFRHEIINYEPVFTRNFETYLPPPPLTGLTSVQVQDRLAIYTLKEIVDAYEITTPWSGRQELLNVIETERRGGSKWSWRHSYCNNDTTPNLIDIVPHGEMNKDDPNNPTLSYGVIGNYRCYQMEELVESFRTLEDGTFVFGVPDYAQNLIDPTTGIQLVDRFPVESIRQLDELLNSAPATYNQKLINELRTKIQEGFDAQNAELQRIRNLRSRYEQMTPAQQSLVNIYLAWVFMFGFWMRFWRGPGYPWTTSVNEMRRQAGRKYRAGGHYGMCPLERDEHSAIQHDIYTALRDNYNQDPVLREWIESLPQGLTERWTKEEWHLGSPLTDFIQRLVLGACQQGGGKYIPMSGYFLITRIIGVGTLDGFNEFMNQVIPYVNNVELQVVNIRLSRATELAFTPEQIATLRERQTALQQPFSGQPPFNPRQMDEVPDTDLP